MRALNNTSASTDFIPDAAQKKWQFPLDMGNIAGWGSDSQKMPPGCLQRSGARHDFDDFVCDCGLANAVHVERERSDQFACVF